MYEKIVAEMHQAMQDKEMKRLNAIRLIVSEIQRDPNKDYSDAKILVRLQTLTKMTKDSPILDTVLLGVIDEFVPPVSEAELLECVAGIDFSALKNKMQAMGIVKKHFTGRAVDSQVLQSMIKAVSTGTT